MPSEDNRNKIGLIATLLMPIVIGIFVLFLAQSVTNKQNDEVEKTEIQQTVLEDIQFSEPIIQEENEEDNSALLKEEQEDENETQNETFIIEFIPPQGVTLSSSEFPLQAWVRTSEPLDILSDLQVKKGQQDIAFSTPILSTDKKKLSLPLEPIPEKGAYTVTYRLCSVYNECESGSYNFHIE